MFITNRSFRRMASFLFVETLLLDTNRNTLTDVSRLSIKTRYSDYCKLCSIEITGKPKCMFLAVGVIGNNYWFFFLIEIVRLYSR